jgi:hypothetical protein
MKHMKHMKEKKKKKKKYIPVRGREVEEVTNAYPRDYHGRQGV